MERRNYVSISFGQGADHVALCCVDTGARQANKQNKKENEKK